MKTVLITGVAGFLGRYAAREFLRSGWRVAGLDDVPPENAPRDIEFHRMHLPDATPDNHIETIFAKDGTGTLMTMRMTLPNEETRAMMLKTGMEHGMEAGYVRLEKIMAAKTAA